MATSVKWAVEDYHQMIAAGVLKNRRVELLAGNIVEVSPEGPSHASRVRKVGAYLRGLFNGMVLVSEGHPITLQQSEPSPDLAMVRLPTERYDAQHPQADDILWLIEIADTTLLTDLNEKQQIYAAAGVTDYWVVNMAENRVIVFRQPVGQDYMSVFELTDGFANPLAFPDIQVSVDCLVG
ncbi:Uma2 family endonuclease [Leptothoe kymatousa]|uniref:Uma2 family endonuclease n=1 Tax=Leptothoe kymatousa TAU-MAC 1615 TaxID=2364775 RepID=A0ABS5Y505_9CYAN|nr:Uma2 family endonuclease [Leptothoe kymatousa]MBT9312924.1 Uma2 family endonuclease [Leptothoe kymatousa TAU-MAC 1615]